MESIMQHDYNIRKNSMADNLSAFNVGRQIDLVGKFGDVDLEPLLDLVQNLGVRLVGNKCDGQSLSSKSSGSSYSVQICVGILWHVVVEYDVDSLDVHSSAEQIGGNQDTLLEILKLLIP